MFRSLVFLRLGAVLLLLLGLARGAGGLALMIGGLSTYPDARASDGVMRAMGAGLVVVGTLAVAGSIALLRRQPRGWWLARLSIVLFVAGGIANGSLLFGRPGDTGTIVNLVVAVAIVACLYLGRSALETSTWNRDST